MGRDVGCEEFSQEKKKKIFYTCASRTVSTVSFPFIMWTRRRRNSTPFIHMKYLRVRSITCSYIRDYAFKARYVHISNQKSFACVSSRRKPFVRLHHMPVRPSTCCYRLYRRMHSNTFQSGRRSQQRTENHNYVANRIRCSAASAVTSPL